MSVVVRSPAVAGQFYPSDAATLRRDVQRYLAADGPPIAALGCIVPHAGYMYSGEVAGAVFARILPPRRVLLLCPNHTGAGAPLALMNAGGWQTPLGTVPIDAALAAALQQRFPLLQNDPRAHRVEHAAEVELPFLQELQPDLTFVPIALGTRRLDVLTALGEAIADVLAAVLADESRPVLLVASSDMNHYESDAITRVKDHHAIARILELDPEGLHATVMEHDISMCGLGPAVAMLTAAKRLGARTADLVKYATSANVSGDDQRVVGYAGVIVR